MTRTQPGRSSAAKRPSPPVRPSPPSRAAQNRETAIAGGLDALERWLCDALAEGLPLITADIQARIAPLVRRLIDAKARGLADEAAEAAQRIAATPASVEAEISRLWLITQAYRRQHLLPSPLRAELRHLIGWTTPHAKLLNDPVSLRIGGLWRTVSRRQRKRWDGLQITETWLLRDADATPAQLLDFAPSGARKSPPLPEPAYQGALTYFPAVTPLRALPIALEPWRNHHAPPPPSPRTLPVAHASWRSAMAATPWRRDAPIIAGGLHLGRLSDGAPALVDAETSAALPLSEPPSAWSALAPEGPLSVFGLWDGANFDLLSVWGPGGLWRTT